MVPRDRFERGTNAALVADAVTGMGVRGVKVTERHDVCVGDRKVSGSAFRITASRAYHHGTMLISSDLDQLKGALRPTPSVEVIDSKAVSSVRSPVTSLAANATATLSHKRFVEKLSQAFINHYYPSLDQVSALNMIGQSELEGNQFIQTGYQELKSWDWIFGQTPKFSRLIDIKIDQTIIKVKVNYRHGKVESLDYDQSQLDTKMIVKDRIDREICKMVKIGDQMDFSDN